MAETKPVRDNGKEPGASLSQSELLITLSRLGASSLSVAMSQILVDFGRLPETVTARNCNVGRGAASERWCHTGRQARRRRILIKSTTKGYL